MTPGWAGPVWGEPSPATEARVPLRSPVTAADAGYRAEGGSTEDFVVIAASDVGVSHRLAGRPCEDAFGWALGRPGQLLVAVADGVSGAKHGGHGAELAIRAACEHVVEAGRKAALTGEEPAQAGMGLCLGALVDANAALLEAAEGMGVAGTDLATTLVVAVVERSGRQADVSLAWVGDSAALVLTGQEWEELGPEAPGPGQDGPEAEADEHVRTGVTAALPGARPYEVEAVAVVGPLSLAPGQALVLVTDGVADALRDGPSTVAPALAAVLAGGPGGGLSPLALAQAADFSRRGCQDDRTIVAVWLA